MLRAYDRHVGNWGVFINVSRADCRPFRPGDIVRHQMFDDDRDRPSREFPVGLVVWSDLAGDRFGILWSGDPT